MLEWLGNGASEESHTFSLAQISLSVKWEGEALISKVGPPTLISPVSLNRREGGRNWGLSL